MKLPKYHYSQVLKHEKDGKINYFKIECVELENNKVFFICTMGNKYDQDNCSPLTSDDYDLPKELDEQRN